MKGILQSNGQKNAGGLTFLQVFKEQNVIFTVKSKQHIVQNNKPFNSNHTKCSVKIGQITQLSHLLSPVRTSDI